jgi:Na+-transporting methylmalonyl-CoA/oxaloacetate decarboxylase gamma subunit
MTEMSNGFVVALGISVVFIGLSAIIVLCKILSAVCAISEKKNTPPTVSETYTGATATSITAQPIENRQEIIAAVSAAIAEELGTDISAIRILSFKKI